MQARNFLFGSTLVLWGPLLTIACGGDPELVVIENLTDGELTVEISEVPDDRPLDTGESRTVVIPFDTMYQTELVEVGDDTSARIHVTGPDGQWLCEYVATESDPAPRLVVGTGGCAVDSETTD